MSGSPIAIGTITTDMDTATTSYLVLKELAEKRPVTLDGLQLVLAPHVNLMISFWITVWWMTAIFVALHIWREYKKQQRGE